MGSCHSSGFTKQVPSSGDKIYLGHQLEASLWKSSRYNNAHDPPADVVVESVNGVLRLSASFQVGILQDVIKARVVVGTIHREEGGPGTIVLSVVKVPGGRFREPDTAIVKTCFPEFEINPGDSEDTIAELVISEIQADDDS